MLRTFRNFAASLPILLLGFNAVATPIAPTNVQASAYAIGNILTESNIAAATDGDLGTAYQVSTMSGGPGNGLGGLEVRFDFDLSAYTSVNSFTFNVAAVLFDPSVFDALWIRPIFGTYPLLAARQVELIAPDGVLVSDTLHFTNSGTGLADDLANWVSGDTLTVFVSTKFGFSSLPKISLDLYEVSADIDGVSTSVPAPAALLMLLLGIVMLAARNVIVSRTSRA